MKTDVHTTITLRYKRLFPGHNQYREHIYTIETMYLYFYSPLQELEPEQSNNLPLCVYSLLVTYAAPVGTLRTYLFTISTKAYFILRYLRTT